MNYYFITFSIINIENIKFSDFMWGMNVHIIKSSNIFQIWLFINLQK